jgi:hypothetical protein
MLRIFRHLCKSKDYGPQWAWDSIKRTSPENRCQLRSLAECEEHNLVASR